MAKPSNEYARYKKATTDSKQRIIASSFGEVGTLKTSFWLTAPGPIIIQSTDKGTEGVVDVYLKQYEEETGKTKDIYVVEYDPYVGVMAQEEAVEIRDKIIEDFKHAIEHAATVVWDKETNIYEIFKYAEFGSPSEKPASYYPLDQKYRHVINLAKETDVNFGLIQGMQDIWVDKVNAKTGARGAGKGGGRKRRGFREVEEQVHINIEHFLDDETNRFMMRIGKSRGPGGKAIQNKTIGYVTFPDFAQLVFPDSDESDWE
jgi:hypothetical protein